jgi:dihydroorotate dehydrogenase/Pyruvate/2-oxoacid:ferredoxin oxidoreductase delta subunit
MPTLDTPFAGLQLRSPIIVASAPPTESVAAILKCAAAGAGAIVTKSIADYRREDVSNIPRRVLKDRRGLWIQGSFGSETLTLNEGLQMIRQAHSATDIPIIASLGVTELDTSRTVDAANRLVDAGAQMVHLDLFYMPQPRCTDAVLERLSCLFEKMAASVSVPFGPKLNIDLPAHWAAQLLRSSPVSVISLLDSLRVPPPLSRRGEPLVPNLFGAMECSLFGTWQKPLSLQYTKVLAEAVSVPICAGGGINSADDAIEAIMLGATCVQVATPIIIHGVDWITRANAALEERLDALGVQAVSELQGLALNVRPQGLGESVRPVIAEIDYDKCVDCPVCTSLTFCSFIGTRSDGRAEIAAGCYGCGLCEEFCPVEGAIRMVPI